VVKEARRERPRVWRPEAFSIMALSMAVMTGATRAPAVAAADTSAQRRRLRLCVFQAAVGACSVSLVLVVVGVVVIVVVVIGAMAVLFVPGLIVVVQDVVYNVFRYMS
jgi:hypothetical protein